MHRRAVCKYPISGCRQYDGTQFQTEEYEGKEWSCCYRLLCKWLYLYISDVTLAHLQQSLFSRPMEPAFVQWERRAGSSWSAWSWLYFALQNKKAKWHNGMLYQAAYEIVCWKEPRLSSFSNRETMFRWVYYVENPNIDYRNPSR